MTLSKTLKVIIKIFFTSILFPIKYLVKKGNIIVLSGPDSYSYCDNCRHLYEHLSTDKSIRVYWYTDSTAVKKHLKSINHLYISKTNILRLIIILLRTKIMINSGTSYINLFGIIDNPFTYKICTNHGSGPKLEAEIMTSKLLKALKKFDYLNYPSIYTVNKLGKELYKLPKNKIISLGYPRCDGYFDSNLISNSSKDKYILKSILKDDFDIKSKYIFYTPTWRKNNNTFPLLGMQGFNYEKFNKWLDDRNIYFLFTSHLNITMKGVNNSYKRIKMIDRGHHHLLDTNSLMMEIDILLNDYSTTSVDISILNKPQIFFFPNGNIYSEPDNPDKIKSGILFLDYYRNLIPGDEVFNYTDFVEKLGNIIANTNEYLSKHKDSSDKLLERYLYKKPTYSGENFKRFIHGLMR